MIFEAHCENKSYPIDITKNQENFVIRLDDEMIEVPLSWNNILVLRNKVFHVTSRRDDKTNYTVFVNGKTVPIVLQTESDKLHLSLSGVEASHQLVTSMPGKIVKVFIKIGDVVNRGQTVIIMEAKKMENPL